MSQTALNADILAGVGPIMEAIAKFGRRTAIGSILRSAEWADMPLAFRERAFFSAGVENVRMLETMQQEIASALAMERDESGAWRDRSSFIGKMREMIGKMRAEAGGIREDLGDIKLSTGSPTDLTDLSSRSRLALIYDMNIRSANGFARWKNDNDPDILEAFPAQELVRVLPRLKKRAWATRWTDAGGTLVEGRMVALKTDPIWTEISAFGTPWPPFDYGSGMGLIDIDRAEAEDLKLIKPGETIEPTQQQRFNENLQASTENIGPRYREALKELFGDQITIDGDSIYWTGDKLKGQAA